VSTNLAQEMRAVLYDAEAVDVITSSLEALSLLVTVTDALAEIGESDLESVARQIEAAARRCLVHLDGASLRGDRAEGRT
jgi:hypothetical protein